MAQKRYLFTPGPTPVPPQVLAALAEPVLHHRAPDFREIYARVLGRLQDVHRTESDVLLFTCSGTGAFESAIVSLCSPGERVLAVSAGSFGERWAAMARTFGCEVEELRYAWGETPTVEELTAKLEGDRAGLARLPRPLRDLNRVVADIQALAAVAKEAGALVVVDAVSSLGAVPLEMDELGLDVVVSGSQKALMTPPGLATAAVSGRGAGNRSRGRRCELLLQLGTHAQGAGGGRQRLHAGRFAHRRSRRRTRAAARRRPRRRVRAPCPPRPRLSRRRQGDGSRALLARRGSRRRRSRPCGMPGRARVTSS
jgi:aspartate aminotransferase-like enzyme